MLLSDMVPEVTLHPALSVAGARTGGEVRLPLEVMLELNTEEE